MRLYESPIPREEKSHSNRSLLHAELYYLVISLFFFPFLLISFMYSPLIIHCYSLLLNFYLIFVVANSMLVSFHFFFPFIFFPIDGAMP